MRSTEDLGDFWGIFLNGFHGGRKGKISPALKKFPAREKKEEKNSRRGLQRKNWGKKKEKKKNRAVLLLFFFSKNIKRLATWVNRKRGKNILFFCFFLKITK
jgi:hypothetical protein